MGFEKRLILDATQWRQNQWTSMFELQQKIKKKIQGLCLLSLSHHDLFLLAQPTWSTQLSYSLFFSRRLLVVLKISLCRELRQSFLCSLTFPTTRSQQDLTTTIDVAIRPLTRSSMWWYKCLLNTLTSLPFVRYCYGTHIWETLWYKCKPENYSNKGLTLPRSSEQFSVLPMIL